MCSRASNIRLAVAVEHTRVETGLSKLVVVCRGATGLSFWHGLGWELEQSRLLACTVESAVGQPLVKERSLGYHRQ